MLGQNFPINDYYKNNIIDAVTIKRGGNWWSAILLIKDPKSDSMFLNFYKWQKSDDGWKTRQRFKIANKVEMNKVIEILGKFSSSLE
tara:strand:- start:164 stop:424 length:261 start_codon:yes stop_codon:yes gene_type:complete